ncbi:MAG: terpene cyclase/mutase family protein [Planctomycetes bacterium]|nr:terpene cyclase/mutase family protein [Planctomycetota bacterium]
MMHVRVVPQEGARPAAEDYDLSPEGAYQQLAAPLRRAILNTRQSLLADQHPDGYWVGELEGDTILESEYVLLLAFLGEQQSDRAIKAARYLQDQQLATGGWAMYPGGQIDVSGSVKAYFALKLTGHDPSAEHMQRARDAILAHGGADRVNSFTRFYLALLGQISYEECPVVPPEMVLLPKWFPINLYAVSAWSRTMIVPLSIMSACRPVTTIDPQLGIRELFLRAPQNWPPPRCPGLTDEGRFWRWDRVFFAIDRMLKWCERRRLHPLRKQALAAAEHWMIKRLPHSDGLGAIFPPMVWSIIALRALGHDSSSPHLQYCRQQLDGLIIEESETIRLQPCKSPVWDTAITLRALADSGVAPDHPNVRSGVRWLLEQQIQTPGDWAQTVNAEPGGWCFEHANPHYPDLDDTAMAVMALACQFDRSAVSAEPLPPGLDLISDSEAGDRAAALQAVTLLDKTAGALERATRWMAAMQNRDGGWGAFDKDNDRQFLCHVPFADHNAMIDPSTPDLTARVLESLGKLGRQVGDPLVDRAIDYLRSTQEADGSWFGRWGVNYIYGTWQVLTGLAAAKVPLDDPAVVAGANWLLAYQQPSGGWGESADSYADPSLRGQGSVTASQTAWAVLGLMAAGLHEHAATIRGVRYLLNEQLADGTWNEPEFTGTGFPQVFYLRYHMYATYFPLMALSRWALAAGRKHGEEIRTGGNRENRVVV